MANRQRRSNQCFETQAWTRSVSISWSGGDGTVGWIGRDCRQSDQHGANSRRQSVKRGKARPKYYDRLPRDTDHPVGSRFKTSFLRRKVTNTRGFIGHPIGGLLDLWTFWRMAGSNNLRSRHITPHHAWAYLHSDLESEFNKAEHDHILECERCLQLFILCLKSQTFGAVLKALGREETGERQSCLTANSTQTLPELNYSQIEGREQLFEPR